MREPGTLIELANLLVAEADARMRGKYLVQPDLIESFRVRLRLDGAQTDWRTTPHTHEATYNNGGTLLRQCKVCGRDLLDMMHLPQCAGDEAAQVILGETAVPKKSKRLPQQDAALQYPNSVEVFTMADYRRDNSE